MSRGWAKGSDTRWRKLRARVLRLDLPAPRRPRCALGLAVCTDVATCVDHIILLSMGGDKYDESNCRPSCEPCNLTRGKVTVSHEPPTRRVSKW